MHPCPRGHERRSGDELHSGCFLIEAGTLTGSAGGRKWENQTLVLNLTVSFPVVDYIWEFSDATVLGSLKNSLTEDPRLQQHPSRPGDASLGMGVDSIPLKIWE